MNDKPIGQRIRAFLEQLFTSRHVRFLEAELVRIRLEKDSHIRDLRAEKSVLSAKIDKLELAIWPVSSRAGQAFAAIGKPREARPEVEMTATNFAQALEEHNRKLAESEASEKHRTSEYDN